MPSLQFKYKFSTWKTKSWEWVSLSFHLKFVWPTKKKLGNKTELPANFSNFDQSEKLKIVLNDHNNVKLTTQFIIDAYDLRSKTINSKR